MLLALVVAVTAVALGLSLGLFPVASRRALGPLRTLAFAAVIAVAVLHLLPEAFAHLGVVGLLVFVVGLAIPRWAARVRSASHQTELGLELGFWGLVAHHVGDGLALGVYARLDEHTGHSHLDVLLALVLHTVPLVAVVSAGYARARGTRHAVNRSAALALASAVGIALAGSVPHDLVEDVQAWIAAGVAGLLLHALSHDLGENLPKNHLERSIDFAAAVAGLGIGWLGANLDSHHGSHVSSLGDSLARVAQAAALPLSLGLTLGALVATFAGNLHRSQLYSATEPAQGATLGPEAFLLSLVHFGWLFAAAVQVLTLLPVLSLRPALPAVRRDPAPTSEEPPARARFLERLDELAPWALAGVAAATLVDAALPEGSLASLSPASAMLLALCLVLGLPLHAMLAPVVAAALVSKGFFAGAALACCVVGPFVLRRPEVRSVLPLLTAIAGAALVGSFVELAPLTVDPRLSRLVLLALVAVLLTRIYRRGLRGWLLVMGTCAAHGPHTPLLREASEQRA